MRRKRIVRDYDRVIPRLPMDAEANELPVLPSADSVSELRRCLLQNALRRRYSRSSARWGQRTRKRRVPDWA